MEACVGHIKSVGTSWRLSAWHCRQGMVTDFAICRFNERTAGAAGPYGPTCRDARHDQETMPMVRSVMAIVLQAHFPRRANINSGSRSIRAIVLRTRERNYQNVVTRLELRCGYLCFVCCQSVEAAPTFATNMKEVAAAASAIQKTHYAFVAQPRGR
jgi:hypothetical protein